MTWYCILFIILNGSPCNYMWLSTAVEFEITMEMYLFFISQWLEKKNGLEECVPLKASQKLRIHRKGSKRASGWAGRMAAIGLQVYISKSRQQQSNIREGQGMELDSLDEEDEEICCTLTFCFQLPFSSSSIIQLETDRQGGLLKCRKGGTPRFFSLSFYWK